MSDIFISSASCKLEWKESKVSLHRPLRMSLCFRWHCSRAWCFRLCLKEEYNQMLNCHKWSRAKVVQIQTINSAIWANLYHINLCNIHVQGKQTEKIALFRAMTEAQRAGKVKAQFKLETSTKLHVRPLKTIQTKLFQVLKSSFYHFFMHDSCFHWRCI